MDSDGNVLTEEFKRQQMEIKHREYQKKLQMKAKEKEFNEKARMRRLLRQGK